MTYSLNKCLCVIKASNPHTTSGYMFKWSVKDGEVAVVMVGGVDHLQKTHPE